MNQRICVLADGASAARRAAETVVSRAREAVERHGSFCLLLSSEPAARALGEQLVADPELHGRMPWEQTHLFFSNGIGETAGAAVPKADLRAACVAWPLPAANLHRANFAGTPGADTYAADILGTFDRLARGEPSPRFDLVVLGLRADASIAGLYGGSAALHETTALAVTVRRHPGDLPRITLTRGVFNRAVAVLILAVGEDKTDALWRVLEGPANFENLPAQTIRPDDGELLWVVDRKAARRLSPARRQRMAGPRLQRGNSAVLLSA